VAGAKVTVGAGAGAGVEAGAVWGTVDTTGGGVTVWVGAS
jgi:hypothetical protein